MRPITVVVPIHNEVHYLPDFLDSLKKLSPNETIFVMDRCTDGSIQYTKERIGEAINYRMITVSAQEGLEWNRRTGYLRRLGYMEANNDLIVTCDADMILDFRLNKYTSFINHETKYVGFGFFDKPLNLKSILRNTYALLFPFKPYSGLYLFSRDAWLETEDVEEAKQLGGEDAHLRKAIETKYKTRHFITSTRHLRTNETRGHDRMRGRNYALTLKEPLWKVTLISLMMFRPHMLLEYIKAKRENSL